MFIGSIIELTHFCKTNIAIKMQDGFNFGFVSLPFINIFISVFQIKLYSM